MDTISYKRCTKCGELKPFSKFKKHPRYFGGCTSQCRDCVNENARRLYRIRHNLPLVDVIEVLPLDHKRCTKCREVKPVSNFTADKNNKSGFRACCKACHALYARIQRAANPEPHRAGVAKSYRKDPLRNHEAHTRYTYGMSADEYKSILDSQNGVCAICGNKESVPNKKNLSVDHDHDTGKIRGLLCSKCNAGIGHLRDDVGLLEKAIEYLKRYL